MSSRRRDIRSEVREAKDIGGGKGCPNHRAQEWWASFRTSKDVAVGFRTGYLALADLYHGKSSWRREAEHLMKGLDWARRQGDRRP